MGVIPPPVKPAGSDTEIQVNDDDAFGASSELSFDASVLTVENAIDLGATGAGGRVQCSQNNQTLLIQHTGSAAVEIKNMTTDTDTNLNIVGPGSGDANIVMSSTSGAGGITFPDSTTQTTAASGGGTSNFVLTPVTASWMTSTYVQNIGTVAPYGSGSIQGTTPGPGMILWPFTNSTGVTLTEVYMIVNATSAMTGYMCFFTDSDGMPDELVFYTDEMDLSVSTGSLSQTSFTGTPTLSADTQYWYGFKPTTDDSGGIRPNMKGVNADYCPSTIPMYPSSIASGGQGLCLNSNVEWDDDVPSTLDASIILPAGSVNRPVWGLR